MTVPEKLEHNFFLKSFMSKIIEKVFLIIICITVPMSKSNLYFFEPQLINLKKEYYFINFTR